MLLDKKRLGVFLGKARIRAGLSQGELAERLGYISPQFVSNWERGVACPPVNKLAQLSKLLQIPADTLIDLIVSETELYLNSELKGRRKRERQAVRSL